MNIKNIQNVQINTKVRDTKFAQKAFEKVRKWTIIDYEICF